MKNTKLFLAFTFAFLFAGSLANAQIVSIEELTTPTPNNAFVFNIDPDGVTFDTIEIELAATNEIFLGTYNTALVNFSAKGTSDETDILGLNTTAMGWSILGSVDTATDFSAAGGPLGSDILAPVDFAQAVMPDGGTGTYIFRFADDGSQVSELSGTFGGTVVDPNNQPPEVTNQFVDNPPGIKFYDQTTSFDPAGGLQTYQILATDDNTDPANLTYEITGAEGPLDIFGNPVAGAFDPNSAAIATGGEFSWDPTGSAQANYFISFNVFDEQGEMDSGVLRINVPEPGTIALAGLGLAGVFTRRRKQS